MLCLKVRELCSVHVKVWFGFFDYCHINFRWQFNAKATIVKEQQMLLRAGEDKEIHIISKVIKSIVSRISETKLDDFYHS